jgi:hypothetical protein
LYVVLVVVAAAAAAAVGTWFGVGGACGAEGATNDEESLVPLLFFDFRTSTNQIGLGNVMENAKEARRRRL